MVAAVSPDEPRILAKYLTGRSIQQPLSDRYRKAVSLLSVQESAGDAKLLSFVLRHPGALPFIDAAVALRRPESALRQRVIIMAAILEATPDYCDEFLARRPAATSGFQFVATLTRAALRAAIGTGLLALIG